MKKAFWPVLLLVIAIGTFTIYRFNFNTSRADGIAVTTPVPVTANQTGMLKAWQVKPGEAVTRGQSLAILTAATGTVQPEVIPSAAGTYANLIASRSQGESSNNSIQAPISGNMISFLAVPGTIVKQGQTIGIITNLKNVLIKILVDEKEIKNIKLGDDTEVTLDTNPDKVYKGKVDHITYASALSFSLLKEYIPKNYRPAQVFPVYIRLNNKNLKIYPGTTASVSIKKD